MKKFLIFTFVAIIATMGTLNAQEKYAIIIGGNMNPGTTIPDTEQWNGGNDPHPVYGFDEFWNDTYLQWEMLIKEEGGKGFTDANVHVLFNDGNDFTFPGQANRYKANYHFGYEVVTDANSNKQTILSTFANLANTITKDDFLYVWIMSHGGTDGNGSYFYSYDNQKVYDIELATLLGNIAAHKKVVVLSFPKSGGFIPELEEEGVIVISAGGATQGASRADNQAPNGAFVENEIIGGIVYNHGEVNYHLVSSLTGYTPLEQTIYSGINLSNADLNSDNYISIAEAITWLMDKNTTSPQPDYSDLTNIRSTTDLEYPTIIHQSILNGSVFSCKGLVGITKQFSLQGEGSTLIFDDNAKVKLLKSNMQIDMMMGANFEIGNEVVIESDGNPGNIIFVLGIDFTMGENVTIQSDSWNNRLILGIVTFSNLIFDNFSSNFVATTISSPYLEISNSNFSQSRIFNQGCQVNISTTNFVNSQFFSDAYSGDIRLSNSDFVNTLSGQIPQLEYGAIWIENCGQFAIVNCTITDFNHVGINIINSGYSNVSSSYIEETIVSDIANPDDEGTGINCYNSNVEIRGINQITNNNFGIRSLNNSLVSLVGIREATYVNETQQICNNNISQIFTTYGAFPYEVRFNAIYGSNNDYLFYYDTDKDEVANDVSYNYWGAGFDPYEDLYPADQFSWLPIWNLQTEELQLEDDEELFYSAKMLADTGNFTQAKSTYRQVVAQYSGSKYATAALKELFAIESGADNDFAALRSYYLSLISEQSPDELAKIADFLSNRCNIVLEDYQDAVEWYEAVIADPPSFPDSLFAIIDLGYLYLQMENSGMKSAVAASMPQYNPASKAEHNDYKDYLISLLYRKAKQEQPLVEGLTGKKIAMLYPNIPNPFTGSTAINYELAKDCRVMLRIYDHTGRTVKKEVDQGLKSAGKHQQTIDLRNLNPGMYLCCIEANGIIADTQKLLKVE